MGQALAPGVRSSAEDQLVVMSLHERLVLQALRDLEPGVTSTGQERSPQLGLTLLSLEPAQVQAFGRAHPATSGFALDAVLQQLRATFEERYHWSPTMGKNRAVARIAHNIGGGGEGLPVAAADAARAQVDPAAPAPVVGVADTAIYPHPDLAGAYAAAGDSMLRTVPPSTEYAAGHGTFIAGAVLSQAPRARLEVLQVLGHDGQADSWHVAQRLVQLGQAGLHVLNMSFGCFTEDNRPPLVLATAVDRLDADVVLVAAAGNHGAAGDPDGRRPSYPAALDDVVAVGATGPEGEVPEWSQHPAIAPWMDVVAGGVGVVSTFLPGRLAVPEDSVAAEAGGTVGPFPDPSYVTWSGTSFAAARVSGAIAARVRPGKVSAKDALDELLAALPRRHDLPWLA